MQYLMANSMTRAHLNALTRAGCHRIHGTKLTTQSRIEILAIPVASAP
jgi:hypothetical protein